MGAWGHKIFEDDSAFDWYDEFCNSNQSIKTIETVFDTVIANDEYVDYDEGMAVFVACEIFAAAKGKPAEKFPDDAYHSFEDGAVPEIRFGILRKGMTDELLTKANTAAVKVRDHEKSELRELWAESDEFDAWKENIAELLERIS